MYKVITGCQKDIFPSSQGLAYSKCIVLNSYLIFLSSLTLPPPSPSPSLPLATVNFTSLPSSYGTYRYEDPQLVYVSQCRALAPYVHDVAVAACEGVRERQWEAMTFEGQIRIQERTSRAASRMGSRTVSKDNMMYD